jgi:hypothetical protein
MTAGDVEGNSKLRNMQKKVMREFFKQSASATEPLNLFALVFTGAGKTYLKLVLAGFLLSIPQNLHLVSEQLHSKKVTHRKTLIVCTNTVGRKGVLEKFAGEVDKKKKIGLEQLFIYESLGADGKTASQFRDMVGI